MTPFSHARFERRVVDNRTLIIGLDDLYRDSMAELEKSRLLECARVVSRELQVTAPAVPVEGYYAEDPALTEYFLLMRGLQLLDESASRRVKHLPEFKLLHNIATSGLYGPTEPGDLLPRGHDPLFRALESVAPAEWTTSRLVDIAYAKAVASDDFSLVALAARTRDPIVLAAARESVVLHADWFCLDDERIEYIWEVEEDLMHITNRFIDTFNQFGGAALPHAHPDSAEAFYSAADDAQLLGRCVMLGAATPAGRYYHWAIAGQSADDMHVHEFWDDDHWTTARYTVEKLPRS